MSTVSQKLTSILASKFLGNSALNKLKYFRSSLQFGKFNTMNHHTMIDTDDSSTRTSEPEEKIVRVQGPGDDNRIIVSFTFRARGKSKHFNLDRFAHDPLDTTFKRLKLNVAKLFRKKSKNKEMTDQGDQEYDIDIQVLKEGVPLDPLSATNKDAWVDGAILKIGWQQFTVGTNIPWVESLKLPSTLRTGCVVSPNAIVQICSINDCRFHWFRVISPAERDALLKEDNNIADSIRTIRKQICLKVGEGFSYVPTDKDASHCMVLACAPYNHSSKSFLEETFVVSSSSVEKGPENCPFEKRHVMTRQKFEPSDDRFRFVTYNILADLYADSDYSREVLFAHCPAKYLEIDYRRQLLMKEMIGYNADIFCMQEVDKKEFKRSYEPYFKLVTGHEGVFHSKGGQVAEGVAMFYRTDRFTLINSHRTVLNRLIDPSYKPASGLEEAGMDTKKAPETDSVVMQAEPPIINDYPHPILDNLNSEETRNLLRQFECIKSKISINQKLYKRFMDRHSVLQTSLLKVKGRENKYLLVANTHFYFAPDADHVRLIQGCVSTRYMEWIRGYCASMLKNQGLVCDTEQDLSIIFCGDLNSSPDCGLYTLLQEGSVDEDHKDWNSNPEEKVIGLSFSTPLRFSSAYKDLPYTNYTPLFNGCLDYIYYELSGLQLERTIPLPAHDDVTATGGIPSEVFPSDHLPLVAELKFR